MRNKEVNEAIKSFKEDMEIKRDETCWYHEKTSTGDCFTCPNRCGTTFIRNTKILNYISELEEENKKQRGQLNSAFDNGFIHKDKIKDKIKELEKEIEEKHEYGLDLTIIHEHEIDTNGIIAVLKKLLEGE